MQATKSDKTWDPSGCSIKLRSYLRRTRKSVLASLVTNQFDPSAVQFVKQFRRLVNTSFS